MLLSLSVRYITAAFVKNLVTPKFQQVRLRGVVVMAPEGVTANSQTVAVNFWEFGV